MYTFYQSMALFWTLAEGLILIFLRSGWLAISGREERQSTVVYVCAGLFLFLAGLMFAGESVFDLFVVELTKGSYLVAYRWGLVTFFCTIWVILEGLIMIYVLRVYRLLRTASEVKGDGGVQPSTFVVPLLILAMIAFYAFYEAHVVYLIGRHELGSRPIYRISVFYIRLCGIFWIVFEWIIAVLGYRTYRALKRWGAEEW